MVSTPAVNILLIVRIRLKGLRQIVLTVQKTIEAEYEDLSNKLTPVFNRRQFCFEL